MNSALFRNVIYKMFTNHVFNVYKYYLALNNLQCLICHKTQPNHIYLLYMYWFIKQCLPMAEETGVQSQVESYQRLKKWYLISPCLTLNIIRYVSRVKWSNPIPWCSSY